MRKGLTTLMTVAIALVSVQAMAIAPTIFDIPSPIVGGGTGSSQTTKYVYPDAFDLQQMAIDDVTTVSQLKWSYEIPLNPKYTINGLVGVNSSLPADEPLNPPDAKNINKTVTDPKDVDKKANTVTIRNSRLAPLSGTGAVDATPDIIDQQAVTFYVSDGAAVSSQTVFFYTDNFVHGNNRLQPNGQGWKMENQDYLVKSWKTQDDVFASVTTQTWSDGKGICFNTQKSGNYMASFQSPYAFFQLTNNSVYRIRATMNSTQATSGKTPFWDFLIENYGVSGGLNLYGMDSYFMDNEGGANSVITTQNGTEYTMLWTPLAVQTTQWKDAANGIYATKYAAEKDPYLKFRVLDVESNAGLRSDQKFGAICMQRIVVESLPIGKFVDDGAPLVNVTKFQAAHATNLGGTVKAAGILGTSVVYSAVTGGVNNLTLTPTSTGQGLELATVQPATDLDESLVAPYTQIADDWPIVWQSNKMLKMEVDVRAPNSNGDARPWDLMWLSIEPPTNELISESYVTANHRIGTPRFNTEVQKYTFFYYTMNETKSTVPQFHYLRWRVRFANQPSLNFPEASHSTNIGGARIYSVKVTNVKIN